MDIVIPLIITALALFGAIGAAAGRESREGFDRQNR